MLPVISSSPSWEFARASIVGAESLAWYPSAGKDFRTLLEFSPERARQHGFTSLPSLFIFTDGSIDPRRFTQGEVLHQDAHTQVVCLSSEPVEANLFPSLYSADINPSFLRRGDHGAALLRVQLLSDSLGEIQGSVLYLPMTNLQFLLGWVGEAGIRICSLVRVRLGLGCGGCNQCLSPVYPWLRWMGFTQLLLDGEAHADRRDAVRDALISHGFPKNPPSFSVERGGLVVPTWSDYHVRAYKLRSAAGTVESVDAERSLMFQLSEEPWREKFR